MLVSKLMPLLVMGGIGLHSGGTIKERFAGITGVQEKFLVKQRMGAILHSATLTLAAGGPIDFSTAPKFRTWVRRNVRIVGDRSLDASKDPWGTPLTGQFRGGIMTLTSAGPDKKFGTKDDVVTSSDVSDF